MAPGACEEPDVPSASTPQRILDGRTLLLLRCLLPCLAQAAVMHRLLLSRLSSTLL